MTKFSNVRDKSYIAVNIFYVFEDEHIALTRIRHFSIRQLKFIFYFGVIKKKC